MSHPEPVADRPATFREVLASREYRAIFAASALSWLGDSMARAAVAALVYRNTGSVLKSGAVFAISYLPWLGIGPVLAALAERYSYRRVMVICDLIRMATMALVAIPRMPLPVMLLLLFTTSLLNPPFEAARSALLPRVLDGDRYVVAISLQVIAAQTALITGYFAGGALTAYSPQLTLLFNAATFGISACLVGLGVHAREPALRLDQRTHLLRETGEGFKLVFGSPILRSIALLVFCSMLFTIVPEGIAAGWAGQLTGSVQDRGWIQGVIMTSNPIGFVVGGLIIGRLVAPATRQRLIRPFALLAPLALALAVTSPRLFGVALISAACGFASAALIPATNGLFVQALPNAFRARAFGVMSSGVMLLQGLAVFATGALADQFHNLAHVVGFWGLGGLVLMLAVILTWPKADRVAEAIESARVANAGAEATAQVVPLKPTSPNGYVPRHAAGSPHAAPPPPAPTVRARASVPGAITQPIPSPIPGPVPAPVPPPVAEPLPRPAVRPHHDSGPESPSLSAASA